MFSLGLNVANVCVTIIYFTFCKVTNPVTRRIVKGNNERVVYLLWVSKNEVSFRVPYASYLLKYSNNT